MEEEKKSPHQNLSEIRGLETRDGSLQGLLEVLAHPLGEEISDIDGPTEELEMPLLQDGFVPIPGGIELGVGILLLQDHLVTLVDHDAGGPAFVVEEDVLGELEDELVKGQVHLGLDFIVKVLGLEFVEGTVGGVIVQVKRVEDVSVRERRAIQSKGLPKKNKQIK